MTNTIAGNALWLRRLVTLRKPLWGLDRKVKIIAEKFINNGIFEVMIKPSNLDISASMFWGLQAKEIKSLSIKGNCEKVTSQEVEVTLKDAIRYLATFGLPSEGQNICMREAVNSSFVSPDYSAPLMSSGILAHISRGEMGQAVIELEPFEVRGLC